MFWLFKKRDDHKWKTLHKSLKSSFDNIRGDVADINDWFHEKHNHHEKKLKEIEEKISYIMNFIENSEKNEKTYNVDESAIERVQSFNRSNQSFNRSNQSIMNIKSFEKLTPAQKEVVTLLVYMDRPLGYEDIAKNLGLNIVTVRRHVNDIFKIGLPIREKVDVRNRRKLFYLEREVKNKVIEAEKMRVKRR